MRRACSQLACQKFSTHDVYVQLKEAKEQKRVLPPKMAELEEANSRLQALEFEAGKTTAGDDAGKGSTEKKKVSVEMRRVVTVGENDSKEVLMGKILALEDEINDLLAAAKKRDEEIASQSQELTTLRVELQDARDVGRRMELQLLKELDMLHDKNTVLSSLLSVVQDRCDDAEAELEKFATESSPTDNPV